MASDLIKRVKYVEVESPNLKQAYRDEYWPKDLLAIRDNLPSKRGTPRWLVIKDGKLISNVFPSSGLDVGWKHTLTAIEKAVGA